MSNITSPTQGSNITTGSIEVTGTLDAEEGFAWIVMTRADSNVSIWPKAAVSPGAFSHSIFEGGDPGAIVCKLILVDANVNAILQRVLAADTGVSIQTYTTLDSVALNKTV